MSDDVQMNDGAPMGDDAAAPAQEGEGEQQEGGEEAAA